MTLQISLIQTAATPTYYWWNLVETKHGQPPEERVGMYTYPQVLAALRNKLSKYRSDE